MKHALRTTPRGSLHLRVAGDGSEGIFEALVMNYNVVDDYNTTFIPGVFSKSLKQRKPRVCWSHDWAEPIGQVVDYTDSDKDLRVTCQLDDFDAVPMARRAWVQMSLGTIDQFSVGFWMQGYDMPKKEGEPVRITKGQLDEISPVLVGAVPKTKLLAVRSRLLRVATADGVEAMLPASTAAEVLSQLAIGDIDLAEALIALKAAAVVPPDDDDDEEDEEQQQLDIEDKTPELSDAELEAQAAEAKLIEIADLAAIDDALAAFNMA